MHVSTDPCELQIYRVVGPARARELIYTARVLKGPEAADLGLVKYPCFNQVFMERKKHFQVNHCVEQNADGDAAYQRSLQVFPLCSLQLQTSFLLLNSSIFASPARTGDSSQWTCWGGNGQGGNQQRLGGESLVICPMDTVHEQLVSE